MTGLIIDNISHSYGQQRVLSGVSLSVARGELVCLLGPSGCGKSTLLRIVAGLETLQAGKLRVGGVNVAAQPHQPPPELRHVGMVFQDFALFPHLTVRENIAFGLRGSDPNRLRRIEDLLEQVGLVWAGNLYPSVLSGGEQQRVALARALAPNPGVMLLDEPFSNLDATLRFRLRMETRELLRERMVPTLLVTHDPEEALAIADRIVLMQNGKVIQVGRPTELYRRPINAFAARFLGPANFLDARILGHEVQTALGNFAPSEEKLPPGRGTLLVRPENLTLELNPQPGQVIGVVRRSHFCGPSFLVEVVVPGLKHTLQVRYRGSHDVLEGMEVAVMLQKPSLAFINDVVDGQTLAPVSQAAE